MALFPRRSIQERYATRENEPPRPVSFTQAAATLGWLHRLPLPIGLARPFPVLAGFLGASFPPVLSAYQPPKLALRPLHVLDGDPTTFRVYMVIAASKGKGKPSRPPGLLLWMFSAGGDGQGEARV